MVRSLRARCTATALALLVACGGGRGAGETATSASPGRRAQADTLGCSAESVSQVLLTTLNAMRRRNPVPALSAAAQVPSRMTAPATAVVGVVSLPTGRSVNSKDRFLAGSVGTTFFAALALRRAGRGELSLDAPLTDLLPTAHIPAFAWITPRMLLAHTSGIGEYDGEFMTTLAREPLRTRTARDWLGVIERHPPTQSEAGKFRYSDLNHVVLAKVLDAGPPDGAYDAIDTAYLRPLGLTHTARAVSPRIEGLVAGHEDRASLFGAEAIMRDGALIYNPQFEWGGGGFVSTPRDLARWMVALRDGSAFPDTLWSAVVAKPAGIADTAHHWRGVGLHVDAGVLGMTYGHSGYMPGYVSWMRWYDELGVSVAMQVNATDRTRLIDDGFDWMDSMAVAVHAVCAAPTRSGGGATRTAR